MSTRSIVQSISTFKVQPNSQWHRSPLAIQSFKPFGQFRYPNQSSPMDIAPSRALQLWRWRSFRRRLQDFSHHFTVVSLLPKSNYCSISFFCPCPSPFCPLPSYPYTVLVNSNTVDLLAVSQFAAFSCSFSDRREGLQLFALPRLCQICRHHISGRTTYSQSNVFLRTECFGLSDLNLGALLHG
jgi:hypothetical protein